MGRRLPARRIGLAILAASTLLAGEAAAADVVLTYAPAGGGASIALLVMSPS